MSMSVSVSSNLVFRQSVMFQTAAIGIPSWISRSNRRDDGLEPIPNATGNFTRGRNKTGFDNSLQIESKYLPFGN